MQQHTAKIIVRVISIVTLISALMLIGGGIFGLTIGGKFALQAKQLQSMSNVDLGGAMHIGVPQVLIDYMLIVSWATYALGIIFIVIALGLWYKKNWARIAALVVGAINIISILALNIPGVIIGIFYIWFFGFNKTVKELFANRAS